MKLKRPLISIVTVCFNSEKTIERTIKSVLQQCFDNYEYLIVDGNSTDNTLDIVKRYEPLFEGRLKWKSEPDDGIYDAFSKGCMKAVGKFIWIVNSDDFIEPGALTEIAKIANNSDGMSIIVGAQNHVNEKGEVLYVKRNNESSIKVIFNNDWMINHAATIVPKIVYERYGYYDTRFKICADMDWFHRCYKYGVKFICTDFVFTNFSIGGISTSLQYKKEAKDRWLYFSKNYPLLLALLKFIYWHKMYLGTYIKLKKL